MTNTKKNAPEALHRDEGDRSTNNQKEETMNTTVPRIPAHFDTAIHVAGVTVAPNETIGDERTKVSIDSSIGVLHFTPGEACSLAAALQAVGVHLMEQAPRTIHRHTEAGQPAFEEAL